MPGSPPAKRFLLRIGSVGEKSRAGTTGFEHLRMIVFACVMAEPFGDEVFVLPFGTVADGAGKRVGRGMTVDEKVVGATAVPGRIDPASPEIRFAHSGVALMCDRVVVVVEAAFGKHDPVGTPQG